MEEQQHEIWKDIVIEMNGVIYDYTGLYQVSNLGRIKRLKHGRYKKEMIKSTREHNVKNKYTKVALTKDGKSEHFYVHRIVAAAFIPNPDNLPVVNHKDENKSNNCVENLEWCTQKYNMNYGTCQERRSKKMKGMHAGEPNCRRRQVLCLNNMQIFDYVREAQEWCGGGDISGCCKGKQKTAGKHPETGEKLQWMYYEDWIKLQENEKIAD